jgi:DNA polymerase-3 subunit gamma/tau
MLSASAFNALLKTIEEPPEYVIFIFATTETQKVPATIRSRCQQFHFQLIPLQIIKEVLVKTAQEMAVNAEDEALFWIAKEATGSMRDAYTLFDQVVSFSNGNITMQQIQDKLGLAGVDTLSSLFLAIWEDQPQQALSLLHTLLDAGVSIEQCIKDIAEYIRTLLLIGRSVTQEAILGIQMNRIPHVLHTAYSDEQLEAALDLFLRLYRDIRYSVNPRFELELAVSRLSRLKYLTSSVTLVEKMQQLKEELMSGSVTVTTAPKQQIQPKTLPKPEKQTIVEKEVPKPQQPVAPIKMELKPITRERLPEIIQQVAAERDPVGIILSQVVDVYQDETHLTFVFASAYALQNAKQNEQKLQHLILRLSGYDGPIQYILEEKEKKEELKPISDEVAQTIATVFRGEIVQNR